MINYTYLSWKILNFSLHFWLQWYWELNRWPNMGGRLTTREIIGWFLPPEIFKIIVWLLGTTTSSKHFFLQKISSASGSIGKYNYKGCLTLQNWKQSSIIFFFIFLVFLQSYRANNTRKICSWFKRAGVDFESSPNKNFILQLIHAALLMIFIQHSYSRSLLVIFDCCS